MEARVHAAVAEGVLRGEVRGAGCGCRGMVADLGIGV